LVKSPSISTQQQKQFHKQQLQSSSNAQHSSSSNPNSSSLKQQQPLLITPKLHQLEASNGQELMGLDGIGNSHSPLVACMPPSSQFRPIPHKSIMPAHEPPHHHQNHQQPHPQQQQQHPGTLLNPSTAMLSSKFFTAPTLPK